MSKKILSVSLLTALTISTGFAHCGSCEAKAAKAEVKKTVPATEVKKVCPVVTAKKTCPINSKKKMCPKKAAKVAEFLEVSDTKRQYNKTLDLMIDNFRKQNTPRSKMLADTMEKFFAKYMSYSAIKPLFIKSYSEVFTMDEVNALVKFYKTETGKMLVKKQLILAAKMNTMVTTLVKKHELDLQKMIQQEFTKASQK